MRRQRGTGGVSLRTGSRFWQIKYYLPGSSKPVRESSGSTDKREAERLLKRRLAEIELGQFKGMEAERATFEDLAALIVNDYTVNKRRSMQALESSLRHLRPFFSRYLAKNITPDKFTAYIRERQAEGAAAATIKKERAALKRMFTLGESAGLVMRSPKFPSIRVENARQNFFEPSEFRAVVSHLPSEIAPIVEFAYFTGWRKREVLGLTWADVSFELGEVRLTASRSKNGEGRVFPFSVHPRLKQLLETQREHTCMVEKRESKVIPWVFHRNGRQIKDFRGAWKAACKKAGVPNYWFHDFRRSAVRNLLQAGVPEIVAMKLTGHKSRAVFERYAITDKNMLEEAVGKLADYTGSVTNGESKGKIVSINDGV